METIEKQKPLLINILAGKQFISVPRFWVDSLMGPKSHFNRNGVKRGAPSLPGSFWKYTLVLWRYIQGGNHLRETTMAMSQFYVRADAAVRWTAAYSVSGLFDVEIGKYTANHDAPTKFTYRVNANEIEWECFITALDLTLNNFGCEIKRLSAANKYQTFRPWSNTGAFKVMLALKVDKFRNEAGLPIVNQQFLLDASTGFLRDTFNRPFAKSENGKIIAIFYPSSRTRHKGESDQEMADRLRIQDCYHPRLIAP